MTRILARRLAKLEASLLPSKGGVPRVVVVPFDSTPDAALRAFAKAHPIVPRGHALLVVPGSPRNAEETATLMRQFREQQIGIVLAARSERQSEKRAERFPASKPTFPPGMRVATPYPSPIPYKWSANYVRY